MQGFAAKAADPTFVSQYGPLIAALIALAGAMTTLVVSGHREERRRRAQAEDEYRREQRQAVAAIAVAAHEFRRNTAPLADPFRLTQEGYESATRLREETESASADLLNTLTVARLLVHDAELQGALDALLDAWSLSNSEIRATFTAFLHERPQLMSAAIERLADSWQTFDDATTDLHEKSLTILAPLIVADNGRRR
jgi:hypothetical protein